MYLHEQIIDAMLQLQEHVDPPLGKHEMVAEMAQAMHLMLTFSHGALTEMIAKKKAAEVAG